MLHIFFNINKKEKLYNPLCEGVLDNAAFTYLLPIYYV